MPNFSTRYSSLFADGKIYLFESVVKLAKSVVIVGVVSVLSILTLPYISPLPFLETFSLDLGKRYVNSQDLQMTILQPLPMSSYVVREQTSDLPDYRKYVLTHDDLRAAYENEYKNYPLLQADLREYLNSDSESTIANRSVSDWGRSHYLQYGEAENRVVSYQSLESLSVRKQTEAKVPPSALVYSISNKTRKIRIDVDSDSETISIVPICFSIGTNRQQVQLIEGIVSLFKRALPFYSVCWHSIDNIESTQIALTMSNSESSQLIESAYSLNDLVVKPSVDDPGELIFYRDGNDPYIELDELFLGHVRDLLMRNLVSRIVMVSWLSIVVLSTIVLLICWNLCFFRNFGSQRIRSSLQHVPVSILLVFCLSMGIKGIDYGDHFDEGGYIDTTKRMLEDVAIGGTLLPHWYGFPSLLFYVSLLPVVPDIVMKAGSMTKAALPDDNSRTFSSLLSEIASEKIASGGYVRYQYIVKTRFISVVCYGISIILIYLIALRLSSDWREGFIAAAFFGLSWETIYHFRMFAPDPIMVPFVLLSFYFLLSASQKEDYVRFLRLASISAGIACGAKYTAVFLSLSIFLTSAYLFLRSKYWSHSNFLLQNRSENSSRFITNPRFDFELRSFIGLQIRLGAWFVLGYLLTSPGSILEPVKFVNDVITQAWIYRVSGGGGYSVWALNDKFAIMSTYFGAVFFSHYLPIALMISIFFLIGLYQVTRQAYLALVFVPFLVVSFVVLLSYNIIYLRNFVSLFPLFAIIAARGFFISYRFIKKNVNKNTLFNSRLPALAYVLIPFVGITSNAHWLWSSTESIIHAQPTETFRLTCDEIYRWKRPLLSSCNAYPNEAFREQQFSELLQYLHNKPEVAFVLSDMVSKEFTQREIPVPQNVSNRYDDNSFAIYYSLEPFTEPDRPHLSTVRANQFNYYQLLPSGPYDVNFSYYPTWPGPNRIVVAPLKELVEDAGTIFTLLR